MKVSRRMVPDELLKQAIIKNYSEFPIPDVEKAWKRYEHRILSEQRSRRQKRLIYFSCGFSFVLLLTLFLFPIQHSFAFKNPFVFFQKWTEKAVHFVVRPDRDENKAKTSPPPDSNSNYYSSNEGILREQNFSFSDSFKNITFAGRKPGFIPAGYKLADATVFYYSNKKKGTELLLAYKNDNQELISIFQKHLDSSTSTSTEGSRKNEDRVEVITVHGIEGNLSITGNGRMDIQWIEGDILIKIYASGLSKDIFLQIAEALN